MEKTLYKNVDICDLKSIMEKGILSMDESQNDNWEDGKRADNDTSVVYLFDPIKRTSFPKYGVALLEVEVEAEINMMGERDVHKNDYIEYITEKVAPEKIKRVIIPELLKEYIEIPEGIEVTWCGIEAEICGKNGLEKASKDDLEQFAKTAQLMDCRLDLFFRGLTEKCEVVDLFEVDYIF